VMGLVLEEEIGLAFLMFAAVSLLSLLLMPDRLMVIPYIIFFGHYGIGKFFIETHIRDKIVRYIVKLLYYNVALILVYLIAQVVSSQALDNLIAFNISLWLLIPLAEIAFVLYDFLFTKVTGYYFNNMRRFLMKN